MCQSTLLTISLKLVSTGIKLVFPDSVFLRVRAARASCSLKVVIMRVVTYFFSRNLTGLTDSQRNYCNYSPHFQKVGAILDLPYVGFALSFRHSANP